jgi:hypothetical protein
MNNKIEIINEQVGNFIMTPRIPPPPTSSIKDGQFIKFALHNQIKEMEHQFCSNSVKPAVVKPTDNNCIIDNNMLYKKLIDLENEIKALKNRISTINFPKPTYYPMQSSSYGAPPLAQHMTFPDNLNTIPGQRF